MRATELQARLAREFGRRGWEWDLVEGTRIVDAVRSGVLDPADLARGTSSTYRQRVDATPGQLEQAIQAALIDVTEVLEETPLPAVTINDNRFQFNVGPGASVNAENILLGGSQLRIDVNSARDDVLALVAVLVRAGFGGDWNPDAATELAKVLASRDDIAVADIAGVTAEVAQAEKPNKGTLAQMSQDIASSGLGGALAVGITQAIGALAANPPF